MRYHTEQPNSYSDMYGERYRCDHPVYSVCTLFHIGENGLAVIQQHYNPEDKTTWWGELDPWLPDMIYLHDGFLQFFKARAKPSADGLYPTVTIRQIMWALRMKPLPKERWETVFDRADI